MAKTSPKIALIFLVIAALAGAGTGFGVYRLRAKSSGLVSTSGQPIQQVAGENAKDGDVFGSPDESTFKDSAEGYLEKGGADGEGSHKLLRPGGASQTVYLTSSSTDLDKFDGMEVKVWGETFKGQKVGWLMDVGRVQIVSVKGQLPEGATAATPTSEGGDE